MVKLFFDTFNKHDWVKMADLYKDPAEFVDPSFGKEKTFQTRSETVKKYKALASVFPDLHDEIQNIYPSGENSVVVEFISTGTMSDKVQMKLPICTVFTIENGLITKDHTYYDNSR